MNIDRLATPIGTVCIVVDDDDRLRAVVFAKDNPRQAHWLDRPLTPARNPGGITKKLARYFAGDLRALDAIATHADGTEFQKTVWRALRAIPAGETRSYTELAHAIERPDAVRAVGHANGSNPLNIVVPCHRVIGANGNLVAYGGGLARKKWLLAHEAANAGNAATAGERRRIPTHSHKDRLRSRNGVSIDQG